ncbi:hypothetical protein CYJ10_10600 [Cupriavidus pauculus]|uniref:Abi family protein n=1 Tax=Cupriavidus pauculus TaxID=82633 RepID=A0A2N5CF50_9BURK|nr:hypothetical protein CYJ10_10600 [Cupriavidus pauculus]
MDFFVVCCWNFDFTREGKSIVKWTDAEKLFSAPRLERCRRFNAEFQSELWSALRKAFPGCPKVDRTRAKLSSLIKRIRMLRNRTFHHEPVLLWRNGGVAQLHREGLVLLQWIHGALVPWLVSMDRTDTVWSTWYDMQRMMLVDNASADGPNSDHISGMRHVVGPHKAGRSRT